MSIVGAVTTAPPMDRTIGQFQKRLFSNFHAPPFFGYERRVVEECIIYGKYENKFSAFYLSLVASCEMKT